jgi:sulfate transport system ATP-binding protein
MSIEIKQLSKFFGDYESLSQINLEIHSGELVALLGPSGSGKTTLLRMIAGLEVPDSGSVNFFGQDQLTRSVKDRNVGFVFQHYALFRHMTVFENIAFGLRVKPRSVRLSDAEIEKKVMELLHLIHLDWVRDRLPSQLSGGQRQRVALARALAVEPQVLLLDEPFGALDSKVRKQLRQWLRRFHKELKITTVFVTHDQEEALEVADRVVVLNKGHIEQVGTPEEVYHRPNSSFVAEFLGDITRFHARVEDRHVYVRPHHFEVSHTSSHPGAVRVKVVFINPAGPLVKLEVESADGQVIQVSLTQPEYAALSIKKDDYLFIYPKEIVGSDYAI